MVEKPRIPAFQNFFQIENQLNIKKVMCRNVCMCFVLTVSIYIALNACNALILCLDSVDIHNIHNIQCIAPFDPLYRPSQHKNEEATAPLNVHTYIR